ncbi:hypothetical protein JNW95_14165, partial [Lacticaseibacillus rhamnosus]|nr:hypothetical protein [Lacticaseibacillus rhamnosus]
MAREKSNVKFKNVSMRIPEELYEQYKAVLAKTGSIVTYDVTIEPVFASTALY